MKKSILLVTFSAVMALATACNPSGPSSRRVASIGSPAPSGGSAQFTVADRIQIWLRYAGCLRAQGVNEPDPGFDGDGNPAWQVDIKTLPQQLLTHCAPILQPLSSTAGGRGSASPERLTAMTRVSMCIRQHGVPDFPDPDPTGNGWPTTSDPNLNPAFHGAWEACKQYLPQTK